MKKSFTKHLNQSFLLLLLWVFNLREVFGTGFFLENYTIGSGGQYASFHSSSITDITHKGVSAPVVLQRLDGVYDEQIPIGAITRFLRTNTIIFQSSELQIPELVQLSFAA